jgi:hypothetical protein
MRRTAGAQGCRASPAEGLESGIPGEKLAEAAGLSVPRVYQIRDGRQSDRGCWRKALLREHPEIVS